MNTDDIESVLKEVVEERTFSLDAVKAIKTLRDDHDTLGEELKKTKDLLTSTMESRDKVSRDNAVLRDTVKEHHERVEELLEREVKCMRIEVVNEYQGHRVKDLRDIMLSLTRNLEHRRELNDNFTRNGPDGGYSNNVNHTDEKTETV